MTIQADDAGDRTLARRHLLFGVYALCVSLAYLPVLARLVAHSRESVAASHVVVIPFVSMALIYRRRESIFSSVRRAGDIGVGAILGGAGLLLAAAWHGPRVRQGEALTATAGALVALWIGGFVLFYGRQAFRAALFPLAFLGFTIPLPATLLDKTIAILTEGSAEAVAGLFALTGTPYHRDGAVFTLSTVVITIADECSGIRSSIALTLTTLLAGQMFLESTWTRTILVLVALPITIAKNGIRIASLSLLALYVDPGFLTGRLHHEGGIAFYLLALVFLTPILAFLRRVERRRVPDTAEASPTGPPTAKISSRTE